MDGNEVVAMRMEGKTFQQIADFYGVSKQAVNAKFHKQRRKIAGERGRITGMRVFNINSIKYKGLFEHFLKNEKETVTSFTQKVYELPGAASRVNKMRSFLSGKNSSHFTIEQMKKMCSIVGQPFEEVFEER